VVLRGIVNQPFGDRPRVVPDVSAGLRIESIGIVGGSDKHESVENHRRDFQAIRIGRVEYPLRAELTHILRIDLIEAAEAAARIIPIVGKPICPHRLRGKGFRRHPNRGGNGNSARLLRPRGGQGSADDGHPERSQTEPHLLTNSCPLLRPGLRRANLGRSPADPSREEKPARFVPEL